MAGLLIDRLDALTKLSEVLTIALGKGVLNYRSWTST